MSGKVKRATPEQEEASKRKAKEMQVRPKREVNIGFSSRGSGDTAYGELDFASIAVSVSPWEWGVRPERIDGVSVVLQLKSDEGRDPGQVLVPMEQVNELCRLLHGAARMASKHKVEVQRMIDNPETEWVQKPKPTYASEAPEGVAH